MNAPLHTAACVCLCYLQANSLAQLLYFGLLGAWTQLRNSKNKWHKASMWFIWKGLQIARRTHMLTDGAALF